MNQSLPHHEPLLALARAWNALERRLDALLGGHFGLSFAEYRLMRAIADAPGDRISRVDLAAAVGLSPSGVTRALGPLDRRRIVTTVRSDRDARRAMAKLTAAGQRLLDDAAAALEEWMQSTLAPDSGVTPDAVSLLQALTRD